MYYCTPKALYNHEGGGLSSITTSVLMRRQPQYYGTSAHTSYRWRGERVIEPIKCMRSPHTSYRWRGERVIEPIKCMRSPHTSYRWRGERVIEPIKCMRSPHTSYRWRGERVIEPIKCMRSPHTSYRWRGERVRKPIKWIKLNPFKLPVNRFLGLVFRMERIWWTRAFWSSTHSSGRITGSPVKCSMGSVLTSTATGCAGSATRAGKGSMKSTL